MYHAENTHAGKLMMAVESMKPIKRLFWRQLLTGLLFWAWMLVAHANSVITPDGVLRLEVPEDFTELSPDEIAYKWRMASAPGFAVGNASRSTSIAYDLKQNPLPEDGLPKALEAFEGVFNRIIPGIDWKRRELIELAGRRWMLMEFGSHAVDDDMHNIMLVTSYQNRMLTLNFNSTHGDFLQMESALRRSIQSIAVLQP